MEATQDLKRGGVVIPTPGWFIALRVFQIVLALVIVALTGWWIHGLYYDVLGFVIVCGIFTWVIALYTLLSEKVASCRHSYNTWATLALDLLMVIFWLGAMAATADLRTQFSVPVNASCASDGSAIDSGECILVKRDRIGVASKGALSILSGIAGLSALVMLLFVVTFAYVCHFFRISWPINPASDAEKGLGPAGVIYVNGTELQGGMVPPHSQTFANQQPSDQQWTGQTYVSYAPQDTGHDAGATGVYPHQSSDQHQQQFSSQVVPASGQVYGA
ncbi:hypothetical protein GGR52DRAFT_23408 [Hypoxylon sp. FL1284]|nr:hypothetical protein GGR52DRAFT_23408 [Hypoxylon sp. FL1284]